MKKTLIFFCLIIGLISVFIIATAPTLNLFLQDYLRRCKYKVFNEYKLYSHNGALFKIETKTGKVWVMSPVVDGFIDVIEPELELGNDPKENLEIYKQWNKEVLRPVLWGCVSEDIRQSFHSVSREEIKK